MNPDAARQLARRGTLYPSLILHGGDEEGRRAAALDLARALLCERPADERPCGGCRHCRRVTWPGDEGDLFHPDFHLLERPKGRTSTPVEATRELLRAAQVSPFEARGQVFVVTAADTLSAEAGDALLKALEEPPSGAPRNYLLLAPSQYDLLATLRSRSLAVYLGPAAALDEAELAPAADELAAMVGRWAGGGSSLHLLIAAELLTAAGGGREAWSDTRASRPWGLAAATALRAAAADRPEPLPPRQRRALLDLAAALLDALPLRLRGIPAERIVEGLVFRHLARAG